MYIHQFRDKLQEEERKRQEEETFWNVFGLPLGLLAIVIGAIVAAIIYIL